jgi:hypothetical protein
MATSDLEKEESMKRGDGSGPEDRGTIPRSIDLRSCPVQAGPGGLDISTWAFISFRALKNQKFQILQIDY